MSFSTPAPANAGSIPSPPIVPINLENYQQAFGQLQQLDLAQVFPTTFDITAPNIRVNHNVWQVPSNFLERWKWIAGVENRLDAEIKRIYESNASLLENTQATSIEQLRNQLWAFWHLNRQIKDYQECDYSLA